MRSSPGFGWSVDQRSRTAAAPSPPAWRAIDDPAEAPRDHLREAALWPKTKTHTGPQWHGRSLSDIVLLITLVAFWGLVMAIFAGPVASLIVLWLDR